MKGKQITWHCDPRKLREDQLLPCPACNGKAGRATKRATGFQHFLGLWKVSCQRQRCAMGTTYFHPAEWNSLPRHDAASMNRAHPVETRKTLQVVDTLVREGIRFVPVPAFSDEEFAGLMELAAKKFDKAAAEARKKNE